jgi:hypothetical protein
MGPFEGHAAACGRVIYAVNGKKYIKRPGFLALVVALVLSILESRKNNQANIAFSGGLQIKIYSKTDQSVP